MSRPRKSIPKFCISPTTGRAFCKVHGRFVSLGQGDTPESRQRYAETLAAMNRTRSEARSDTVPSVPVSVNEVLLKFASERLPRYLTRDGKPSAEQDCYRIACRIVRNLYGTEAAAEFGPLKFRQVRNAMIDAGWSRRFINKQCVRLRSVFRYAASFEMIPVAVVESLRTLAALRPGESAAKDHPRRRAVPADHLASTKSHLSERNQDLVDLLIFTGARPSELLSLRCRDVDQTQSIWEARLENHKNAWREHDRTLYFGPRAQAILSKYLRPERPEERLFQTSGATLTQSIRRACRHAEIPEWTAYALRHTAATNLADEIGIDAARAVLGHRSVSQTLDYARSAKKQAIDAVTKHG